MGLLTTEHGRAGYLADFIVYGAASGGLAALLVVAGPHERWPELVALVLLGLIAWTRQRRRGYGGRSVPAAPACPAH